MAYHLKGVNRSSIVNELLKEDMKAAEGMR